MATTSEIQDALEELATQAREDLEALAAEADSPEEFRALLFAAVPVIVALYGAASMELGLGWYEELREAALGPSDYLANPIERDRDEYLRKMIAKASEPIWRLTDETAPDYSPTPPSESVAQILARLQVDAEAEVKQAMAETLALIEAEVAKEIADVAREVIVENAANDPKATGWRRVLRGDGDCPFCRFQAARGAVFKKDTAVFSTHLHCDCGAVAVFKGQDQGPEADVLQYVAASRDRTPREKKALREYLEGKYGSASAPGGNAEKYRKIRESRG